MTRISRWLVQVSLIGLGLGLFVTCVWLLNVSSGSLVAQTVKEEGAKKEPTPSKPRGLAGDGVTDDAPGLQKAIDASAGAIVLPTGTYLLKKTVVIDLAKVGFTSIDGRGTATLKMVGEGPALRIVGTHGGTADPNSVKPGVWQKERAPLVRDLEIIGSSATDEKNNADGIEADGIEADGTMQLTLRGLVMRHLRHAVHLVNRNRNVLIEGCHIYENRGIGVFYDHVNLHQSNINGCHISYCRQGGVVNRGGDVRNIHISGCDIEANMGDTADSPAAANIFLDCTGGSVAEVAIVGCTIQHGSKCPDGANIRVWGEGVVERKGERLKFQCGHITIADNVLSDVQTNIELKQARGVTITGNTLWQGYKHNLVCENCTQLVIGSNLMERNPLYGYTSEANNTAVIKNCSDSTISGLQLHHPMGGEPGLLVEKCQRLNITGCTFLDCRPAAVELRDVSDSRLSDCLIQDDLKPAAESAAVIIRGGRGNMVVDNRVPGGIVVDDKNAHHMEGNYQK
ncbi:right-handed parallel beta-helix repeat-containing protein [Anatilimnocola floriformis]|uniref:right-handed parallel beta-helix repeat-containing protein n=1 Tax=Anatilimnocola floriformis TaxID=2948575 RepID=UPI0020C391DA|nr:right-handed parallel beta-helix repeat-containing protein [Anatilimnocola floriformis]